MSSFLCFICHSTVNSDNNEETREKYKEVVGIHLCSDSHLCHICCHILNKLWLFKSVCLKRSLEYPVLFREKGTLNLQKNDTETHVLCPEDTCQYTNSTVNKSYHFIYYQHYQHQSFNDDSNKYVELEEEKIDDYTNKDSTIDQDLYHNDIQTELCIQEDRTEYSSHEEFQDQLSDDLSNNNQTIQYTENEKYETPNKIEVPNDVLKDLEQDSNIRLTLENTSNKRGKTKKVKKKGFERVILSLEEQKAELEALRREKKYLEAEFKCYNCALGFLFKDTYQAHMMRHEESNGEHRCRVCTLRFAGAAVLRAHAAAHAERRRCAGCGRRVGARAAAAHACGAPARGAAPRREHSACHLCASMFRDASALQQHLKRFHQSKNSGRSYSCSVCGKSYNNQGAVRTHMIKHINRKFTCDQCTSTFSSPYTLNQHKKKHLVVDNQESHYCTTCGISYSSRKSLLAHRRNALNHQQTVFECPICSRICPNRRALASHVETVHSTSKDYVCPHCPSRYTSRKSLVRHIRNHTQKPEPKLAVCHLCGNSFKGNNKLNRHLREVCEKAKLEEELSNLYDQEQSV